MRPRGVEEIRLRLYTLNLGFLNTELLELTNVLRTKRVDITCIQETKWKGVQARECYRCKLWYFDAEKARNGVGILLSSEFKDNVIKVSKRCDMIMMIKVIVEDVVNI